MYKLNFSKNLKRALENIGMTQKALAYRLGTTQQTISRWLNGINEPDLATLLKICETVCEDPNSILDWEEFMYGEEMEEWRKENDRKSGN